MKTHDIILIQGVAWEDRDRAREKRGVNDVVSVNEIPVQILGRRFGVLVPNGAPGDKL